MALKLAYDDSVYVSLLPLYGQRRGVFRPVGGEQDGGAALGKCGTEQGPNRFSSSQGIAERSIAAVLDVTFSLMLSRSDVSNYIHVPKESVPHRALQEFK